MTIIRISNNYYFLSLDVEIDHTRQDAYFIVETGIFNTSGSYRKHTYTTGKAAFRKYEQYENKLFSEYGIK